MSMNEPRSIHAAEDWGVVLQSVPSKHKKEIVKRLVEIFELDRHDAEQVLSNMPLILVDNISFGLAARIKKYFQKIGAVAETTNHDMIKKNCFQIVWPQTPDLSFFMKDETRPAEAPAQGKKEETKPVETPSPEKKAASYEARPEPAKIPDAPAPVPLNFREAEVTPVTPSEEPPVVAPQPVPPPMGKAAMPSASSVDSEWEKRANELNEKLRKIQDEKERLHEQHVEASEKVKNEFQQRIDQEKQKSDDIAKAYEDLRTQAQKQEALSKEGEEWRSKAMALGEKVRGLETDLMQKASAIEHLIQQKDDLAKQSGRAEDLAARVADLEGIVAARDKEKIDLQHRVSDFEKDISDARHELQGLRGREQDWTRKVADLEHNLQEMKESLRSRDGVLAQFEQQMLELTEKIREYESLKQEHGQLVRERATIRKEYDAKLVEQEVRLAKVEEEHRRYRSRADRKSAAATRELGEWVRGVDNVRQGLQKLILFLGSESAVLETEKKFPLRSPLTRGPDAPIPEKNS